MDFTKKIVSRINIFVTVVATFAMVLTPFAQIASAYTVDYGYPDYTVDYGYPDYTVDYSYPNWTTPTYTNTCGSACSLHYTTPIYTTYPSVIYPTTCTSNCYPTYTYPVHTPPAPCVSGCTPTSPSVSTTTNNNTNNNSNSNVNNINIQYPNVTYPDINITNTNINNNGGGTTTQPQCGTWNNWCQPQQPQCGTWNNWCQPVQNPSVFLTADNTNLSNGQSTTLRWTGTNVNSCYASNGWSGSKSTSGSEFTGALYSTRTYVINCTGYSGQNVSDSVTVYVNQNNLYPTVDLTADQTFLNSGQSTILRWVSSNANSCYASDGWYGSKNTVGSEATGALYSTRTYVINCTGYSGQNVTDSVTVNVSGGGIPNQANTVITQSPTGITSNSAILNGLAINNVSSGTTMWFEWATNSNVGLDTPHQSVGVLSGSRSFSWTLGGLMPNTTYYYRAVSETSTGIARGLVMSFTTGSVLGISTGPVVTGAEASITKTLENNTKPNGSDSRVTAWPGDEIKYTITVKNTGSATLRNLTVTDVLPKGIVYVNGGSYNEGSNKVTWNIDRLTIGETKTLFLDTMVTECSCDVDKSNIDNTASVTGSQISKKTSSAATVSVSQNDLAITLDADRNQVKANDVVNYELVLTNNGQNLKNGSIRIILPDSLTFKSATASYKENANVYTFDVGSLRAGSDQKINISAEVKSSVSANENITISAVATYKDYSGNDVVSDIDETINVSSSVNVAAAGLSGFFPDSFIGWLLLIILAVILILLVRWLFIGGKKEEGDGSDEMAHGNHGVVGSAYRTPSAYDKPVAGHTNGVMTFDSHSDHDQAVNELSRYTDSHDDHSSFPSNLPR